MTTNTLSSNRSLDKPVLSVGRSGGAIHVNAAIAGSNPMDMALIDSVAMSTSITDDAVGKTVVNAHGDKIGIVSAVKHGTARVDPDPGVTDKLKAKLGWEDTDLEDYPLQERAIAAVTDDEIRLRADL